MCHQTTPFRYIQAKLECQIGGIPTSTILQTSCWPAYVPQTIRYYPCKYRIALTRLIVSSHRLSVETGRWERPVVHYESRLCHVCHKLDDEYHFLLECDRYAELRARLIPRYYWVRASMYTCIQLLSSNNRKTVRLLSKYAFLAFRTVQ